MIVGNGQHRTYIPSQMEFIVQIQLPGHKIWESTPGDFRGIFFEGFYGSYYSCVFLVMVLLY